MLTVIIDARAGTEGLVGLLAQLTAGAVDGLVREVLIVAEGGSSEIDALCEETGADAHPTLDAAARAARFGWVMLLTPDVRMRDGWIGSLEQHLASGGGAALVVGLGGGPLRRGPGGVLVESRRVEGQGADLQRLRRGLGFRPRRVG